MKALPLGISLLLSGCVIGQDKYPRPRDLSPAWLVDKPRVLGMQSEPPEARPGEQVVFSRLLANPNDVPLSVLWTACPDDPTAPGGIGFGCQDIDLEALGADPSLEELQAAGVVGFEPFLPPYPIPSDYLDPLDPADRAEGRYVLITLLAFPGGLEAAQGGGSNAEDAQLDIDFNDVEVAYKRVVVSEADTPNHNPELAGFSVDGVHIPAQAMVEVDAEQQYELGVWLAADAIETYTFVNSDGAEESRTEELYGSWFTTDGTMDEPVALFLAGDSFADAKWTAPSWPSQKACPTPCTLSGRWWAVVRDRRGGMSWASRPWKLRDTR